MAKSHVIELLAHQTKPAKRRSPDMKQITQTGATVEEALLLALHELNLTRKQVDVEILQEAKKGFLGFGSKKAQIRVTEKQAQKPFAVQEAAEPLQEKAEPVENLENSQSEVAEPQIGSSLSTIEENLEIQTTSENAEVQFERNDYELAISKVEEYLSDISKQLSISDLHIETVQQGKVIQFNLSTNSAALLIGKRGNTLNALQELAQLVAHQYVKRFIMVKLDVGNYREKRKQSLEVLANKMADKAVYTGKRVELEPMPSNERKIIHHILADRLDVETYSKGEDTKRHLVIEPIRA